MNVLNASWRCSLVATALSATLAVTPAPATADDQPARTPQVLLGPVAIALQPVAADDQPARTPQAAAEREKLEQQLQQTLQVTREKLARLERERAAAGDLRAPSQPAAADREKLEQQLRSIKRKVEQLEKDGKHEEAERLRLEAMALYSKINPRANAAGAPGGPEREALRQQMQAIHEKLEKAMREGKPEDVQRLKQAAEALQARMSSQGGDASGRPPSGGGRDARLQHLRVAAEHLMAAGAEPEAQHVMQMIARLQGEGSEGRFGREGRSGGESTRRSPDGREGPSRATPPGGPAASARDTGNSPAVQELRSQVEQMRRELRELREQLKGANSERR